MTSNNQQQNKVIINDKPHTELKTADFFYELPEELIAQHPAEKRDESRLLVVDRKSGEIEHKRFFNIIDYIIFCLNCQSLNI